MIRRIYKAPCGNLEIVVKCGRVCRCNWTDDSEDSDDLMKNEDSRILDLVISQLDEYFIGERGEFELPLLIAGTPFQMRVWEELSAIPYGETRSYSEIADKCGSPGGQRAVAQACSCNRLAIIVPCHRVVAADSSLGGYTIADGCKERGKRPEGLAIKSYLLNHEQK